MSKSYPLPRCVIPIAGGIEVFGLPGFEKQRGRYLLSLTNAAEAVGKSHMSIARFLESDGFKALLGKAPELHTFAVQGAQKPIVGIPHEIADEYWYDQSLKGNKRARSLSRAFGLPGFEKKRGRYLLSLTNAAEAVGKTHTSIVDFLHSNIFKALLSKAPELSNFSVEIAQRPISGIPPELANIYWAYQLSKSYPLPRRVISIGNGIEVFGLPGFEKKRGRYLLSLTNSAEAIGKIERSIREFLASKSFKALLAGSFEFATFSVEGAQKPTCPKETPSMR